MPRYIDADKLIQRLEREVESCKDPNRGSALGFKMAIFIVQTFRWQEDVVPRAEAKTLYDHIKAMTLEEMVTFFEEIESASVITAADRYICNKCHKEHNNHCPMVDDKCLYDLSDKETIKMWLLGEADEMKGAIK